MRSIETIVLARAAAITLVVANHVQFGVSLHGGLNALLVVSGYSLAQFSFGSTTRRAVSSMFRLGLRLAIPSFLIALFWQIGVGEISIPELGFYSNWLYKSRVALFPIWYSQALSQMLISVILVFTVFDLGSRIALRPIAWTFVLYIFACIIAYCSYLMWDTSYYADKLPHLILWNFAFGWLIWACRASHIPNVSRAFLSLILIASVSVLYLSVDADNGTRRAFVMPMIILPLIWSDRVKLPEALARYAMVASQSTLYIFLFHYYAFWVVWRAGRIVGLEAAAQNPMFRLIVGLLLPIALWAICTGAVKVYRRDYSLGRVNRDKIATVVR